MTNTPEFDPEQHLPMLGAIVVRHVTLGLANEEFKVTKRTEAPREQSRVSACDTVASQEDVVHVGRRKSYRDVAYHAVRTNRIFLEDLTDKTANAKRGRRISIHKSKNDNAARERPRSVANMRDFLTPQSTRHMNVRTRDVVDVTKGITKLDLEGNLAAANDEQKSKEEGRMLPRARSQRDTAFPRADVSSCLQSSSSRRLKTAGKGKEQQMHRKPEEARKKGTGRAVSRLVQMRRQRTDRKKGLVP